jgi:hypothetical protein
MADGSSRAGCSSATSGRERSPYRDIRSRASRTLIARLQPHNELADDLIALQLLQRLINFAHGVDMIDHRTKMVLRDECQQGAEFSTRAHKNSYRFGGFLQQHLGRNVPAKAG